MLTGCSGGRQVVKTSAFSVYCHVQDCEQDPHRPRGYSEEAEDDLEKGLPTFLPWSCLYDPFHNGNLKRFALSCATLGRVNLKGLLWGGVRWCRRGEEVLPKVPKPRHVRLSRTPLLMDGGA